VDDDAFISEYDLAFVEILEPFARSLGTPFVGSSGLYIVKHRGLAAVELLNRRLFCAGSADPSAARLEVPRHRLHKGGLAGWRDTNTAVSMNVHVRRITTRK
jgi:hypothetical protein